MTSKPLIEARAWRALNRLTTLALDDLLMVASIVPDGHLTREDRISIVIGLLKGHTP